MIYHLLYGFQRFQGFMLNITKIHLNTLLKWCP
jgi:hypothetical protein